MLNGALPIRPTGWEGRLRSVRWHVMMNGNKVGNYGDFHMLPSIVKYDRTHPVQLTASNLALPLKTTPEKKKREVRRHGLRRPRQLMETRELVKIGQAGTSRAPRQREKSFGSGWLRTPPFFESGKLDAVLLRYFISHIVPCIRQVLDYTSPDASHSLGQAARILPDCCVTFLLEGQGGSGEGWTGAGTEIPGGRREGAQHNATQCNRSRQKHSAKHMHMVVETTRPNSNPKIPIFSPVYQYLGSPRCHLPPAILPRFGSFLPALLCSCSCSLGT